MKKPMERSGLWFFSLLLLIGFSGFYLVKKELAKREVQPAITKNSHLLTTVRIREYFKNGALKQTLYADALQDLKQEGSLLLTKPKISIHLTSGKINKISAESGLYLPMSKTIHFKNHVLIEEFQPKTKQPFSILKTDRLSFNTETQFASTDAWVAIHQETRDIKALGLKASLKEQSLTFPGKTNIHFDT